MTASQVMTRGDVNMTRVEDNVMTKEDEEHCYTADLDWTEISQEMYGGEQTITVEISNSNGRVSQQLEIFILPYRPRPFLVRFLNVCDLQLNCLGVLNSGLSSVHSISIVPGIIYYSNAFT